MSDNAGTIRVLQSFGVPRPTTNPYLVQLVDALPPEVTVVPFSWRHALVGRYDVVHLHWPELLVRGAGRRRTLARRIMTAMLLLRWWLGRVPVVRTVHNAAPHEAGGLVERVFLRAVDRLTVQRIALNTGDARRPDTTLVPHGHYRDWYGEHDRPPAVPGRIGFVGLVRPYKNVPHLLSTFARLPDRTASLLVAGAVRDRGLHDEVLALARADPRVEVRLEHLPDADLARAVAESSVVVLPYVEMGNSGVALLALSLDRPVLVPRSPAMADLANEVGRGWVRFFDDELDVADLEAALDAGRASHPIPDLSSRGWPGAGRAHAEVYRRAITRR